MTTASERGASGRLISISGPPWAGKTTLFEELMGRLRDVALGREDLPRVAHEILGTELTEADQEAFQHFVGYGQLLREERARRRRPLVIVDKSLIDAFAYWKVLVGEPPPVWSRALDRVRYDLTIVCDHEDVMVDNVPGVSRLHLSLRDRIAGEVAAIARRASRRVEMVSGTVEDRVAHALPLLSGLASVPR